MRIKEMEEQDSKKQGKMDIKQLEDMLDDLL